MCEKGEKCRVHDTLPVLQTSSKETMLMVVHTFPIPKEPMTSHASLNVEVIGKGEIREIVVLLDGVVGPVEYFLIRRIWGEALTPSERHIRGVIRESRRREVVTIEEFGIELRGSREADGWHCRV